LKFPLLKGFESKYTRTIGHFLGFTLIQGGSQGKNLTQPPPNRRRTSSRSQQNRPKIPYYSLKFIKFLYQSFDSKSQKVSLSALEAWTRQLAHLLQGGLPLSKALALTGKTRRLHAIRHLSRQLEISIMQGVALSQALHNYPGVSPAFVQLIAAGEQSGTLDLQMERLADQLARQLTLRRQLVSALAYPLVVLCVSLAVVSALLWWVVPTMALLFEDMGSTLPGATLAVLRASNWVQNTGPWALLMLCVLATSTALVYRQSSKARLWLDLAVLRLPAWGRLRQLHQQSQWTYSLSTLLQAHVPLVKALQSTALASPPFLAQQTEKARQHVIHGYSLSQALEQSNGFDSLLIEITRVGEESGLLGTLLLKAAQTQEAELSAWVSRLTALIEPAMVVALGTLIGGVVLAMYLPMFQMGQLF
jgi:type IV pilus assembly protein PilC